MNISLFVENRPWIHWYCINCIDFLFIGDGQNE